MMKGCDAAAAAVKAVFAHGAAARLGMPARPNEKGAAARAL
jgi:hypothetical protein